MSDKAERVAQEIFYIDDPYSESCIKKIAAILREEYPEIASHTHRWNVEETKDGLRVCKGDHERSAGCEWIEYIPKPTPEEVDINTCPQRISEDYPIELAILDKLALIDTLWNDIKTKQAILTRCYADNSDVIASLKEVLAEAISH